MRIRSLLTLAALTAPALLAAQPEQRPPVLGRWDITGTDARGHQYPSWLEVSTSGYKQIIGRFCGAVGSARPISSIEMQGNTIRFAIPPQWQRESADLRFEGTLEGDRLTGTITNPDGSKDRFTAVRAPALQHARPAAWSAPVTLSNSMSGWQVEGGNNNWSAKPGSVLANAGGGNLVSEKKYGDFKLHAEVKFPKDGNSGIYLRGRYEVQVEDTPPTQYPLPDGIGGVYGVLYPNENASLGPDTWNVYDITLVGRRVTVVLNGKTVINDQIIPGPTGGALDSNEGEPGPLMLQGDHTAVTFRNVRIQTPAK